MKTVEINRTFANTQECRDWEDKNLGRIAKENDGVIFMVNHEENAWEDKVTLTTIVMF